MHSPAALVDLDTVRHSAHWRSWGELAADAPPFVTPEFFALVSRLAERGTALVAEAWQPGRLVGAMPLLLDGDVLRALRGDHAPEYDYCGDADGLDAIWDCLRDDSRWNELVLDKVPSGSALAIRLPALARASGCPTVIRPDTGHLYLPLPRFEAAMHPELRTHVERCAREAGDLVLERILVPSRADLDEACALEALLGPSPFEAADPRDERVYHALGRLLGRRGRVSLYFLRVAGKRRAALFAVEDRHTLFALKIGHEPEAAGLDLGHLLVWKVAADAELRGLQELDFVGRDDEWARRWTERVHEHVSIMIFRRSARGLVRFGLREVLGPRLSALEQSTRDGLHAHRCQHADVLGASGWLDQLRGHLERGRGLPAGARRLWGREPEPAPLGKSSRFLVGSWVHVLDEAAVRASLDDSGKLRGLAFVPSQVGTCGHLYRVARHVRRIRDDDGRFLPVSGTVLLEGIDCSGAGPDPAGCGRHCPMMYRDEWLAPAPVPRSDPHPATALRHARVRALDEIAAGLDRFGRHDGLTFTPEMATYTGQRFPIANTVTKVFDHDRWVATGRPVYLLGGVHCSGANLGDQGPCDRACALMWHEDWLIVEAP